MGHPWLRHNADGYSVLLDMRVCTDLEDLLVKKKSFIVQAENPPPKDVFFVGKELVLIQPAKDEQRHKGTVSYFTGSRPTKLETGKKWRWQNRR